MAVSENDLVVGPLTPAAGVTTISLDFFFEQVSWLEVYKSGSEIPLVLNTDYTVAGAGTSSGVVTLTTAANGTDAYSIYLAVPLQRNSDMQLRGEFRSEPFNVEMDRLWQALQNLRTLATRSLSLSRTSVALPPLTFGAGDDTNDKSIVFSSDSTRLVLGPTTAEIGSAQAYAEAALDAAEAAFDAAVLTGLAFTNLAALEADTALTYSTGEVGTVATGDMVVVGGKYARIAASGASDHHGITAGGVKWYEAGPNFSTRARMVAAKARMDAAGDTVAVGTIWFDDLGQYRFLDDGNTDITGMTGWSADIAVSGTVDGRDVAADGTKLDGIETLATANQTFATRAELVTWVASNTPTNGVIYTANGTQYLGETGATTFLDLPGLTVSGVPTPQHFGSYGVMKVANPAAPYLLSDVFASLAAAQAVYPKASALTETVDDMAFQYMVDFRRSNTVAARGGQEINRNIADNSGLSVFYRIPNGQYYITRPVDLTGIEFGHHFWGIEAEGAIIMGNTIGKPIFDLTASRKCVFLGTGTIIGVWTSAGVSRIGIQLGRALDGTAAESHAFRGAWEVKGRFSLAPIYNYASEDVRFGNTATKNNLDDRVRHCQFDGSDGVKVFVTDEDVTWSGGTGVVKCVTSDTSSGEVAIRVVTGTLADNTQITGTTSTKVADINGTPVAEPSGEGPDGRSYGLVLDGDNYWGLTSDYQSNPAADTAASFLRNTGVIDIRHTGRGDAMWTCRNSDHNWVGSYLVSDDPDGGAAIVAFSNTTALVLHGFKFNGHIETDKGDMDASTGLDYAIRFEAATASSALTVERFYFERNTVHPSIATFYAGTNVSSVSFKDCEVVVEGVSRDVGQVMFSDPSKFSFYGRLSCGDTGATYFNVSSLADLGGQVHCADATASNVLHATATYLLTDNAGALTLHNGAAVNGNLNHTGVYRSLIDASTGYLDLDAIDDANGVTVLGRLRYSAGTAAWAFSIGGTAADYYLQNTSFYPATDDTHNLGLTSRQWKNGYIGKVFATTYYDTNSVKVLGTQQAAVSDASGGANVDTEARTAINDLLARLRTHGLIAT